MSQRQSLSLRSRVIPLVWFMTVNGCASHLVHKELFEDRHIMVRGATLATQALADAGDHGVEFSNPILWENTLIFGNHASGLMAIYPDTNDRRWFLPVRGGVLSELTVGKNNLYFGGGDGFFYSVNAENGHINWRYELRNPVVSKPTLADGRVLVTASDDTVYAFDAGAAKLLWTYRRRTSPVAKILGASSPLVVDQDVWVGMSDGTLVSLSLEEGQLKTEKHLHSESKFTDINAQPVLEKGVFYLPSYDGALYALKKENGQLIWRFDTGGGSRTVSLDETRVYLPSSNGRVYALQKSNSAILWQFDLDYGTPTQIVLADSYVIVGSSYQYLYVLNRETGKPLYRFNAGMGSGFSGSLALDPARRRLYALSQGGNLYQFHFRHGLKKAYPHGATDPFSF